MASIVTASPDPRANPAASSPEPSPFDRDFPTGSLSFLAVLLAFSPLYLEDIVGSLVVRWLYRSSYLVLLLTLLPLLMRHRGGVGFRRWLDVHAPRIAPWLGLLLLGWANAIFGMFALSREPIPHADSWGVAFLAALFGVLLCFLVAVRGAGLWVIRRWRLSRESAQLAASPRKKPGGRRRRRVRAKKQLS